MKKIQIFCAALILGISACSDSIDNVVPDSIASQESLSYEDFISTYLSSSDEGSLKYFLANDKDKVNQSLEMINANNGTNYSEENLMPIEYLLSMTNLVKKERALLPNLKILDENTLETVQMDFPGLSLAQITPNEENLRKYYERKLEYAGFEKLSINQTVPFDEEQLTIQEIVDALEDATGLCIQEILFIYIHPLKAPSILSATLRTLNQMENWFPAGNMDATAFGGAGEQDVQSNALRHALWNYNLAKEIAALPFPLGSKSIGLHIAEEWTYAHEQCGPENAAKGMDLHNNKVGRDLFNNLDNLSEEALRLNLFKKMRRAWPACNTIASVQAAPVSSMVYTHHMNAGVNTENNCTPMQVSVTANRPYNGPDIYSWVTSVSGSSGALTYDWYWNNVPIGGGPNLLANITDSMFNSNGLATIKIEIMSSSRQRKVVYVSVYNTSGGPTGGGGGGGPII